MWCLQKLYTAHAGDSGAILARGGRAARLTFDHRPDVPEEAKRIHEAGGRIESKRVVTHPKAGRKATLLAMSRCVGTLQTSASHSNVQGTKLHLRGVLAGWLALGDR
jgi:serine/threonine protein phosphatase PrpC